MIDRLRCYVRRARARRVYDKGAVRDEDLMLLLEPLKCRGCGKRAQVQLTAPSSKYEMLCYEDLGPFLELFADQSVRDWVVTRL